MCIIFSINIYAAGCIDNGVVKSLAQKSYASYQIQIAKIAQKINKINTRLKDISNKTQKNIAMIVKQNFELNKHKFIADKKTTFTNKKLNNIEAVQIDIEALKR